MRRLASALACVCFVFAASGVLAETSGAPLKGVDVKLGRNPGGAVTRIVTTDADGNFTFGVLPAGSYFILIGSPKRPRGAAPDPAPDIVTVSLSGHAGVPVLWHYDRKSASIVDHRGQPEPNAREVRPDKKPRMTFESDGQKAVSGTIVKSKSNIANN